MKKKLIASLAVTLMLAVGVITVAWVTQGSVQAQQNPPATAAPAVQASAPSETEERMQEELAELRALIQALLGMIAEDFAGQPSQNADIQAGVPQMSSQTAMNIAVEHLGTGTAEGFELLEIDGVLTFVIDVANGTVRYVVHVNAMTGVVMNFNTNDAVTGAMQQQPTIQVVTPTPQPTNTPAPRATSSPSSSSPRR